MAVSNFETFLNILTLIQTLSTDYIDRLIMILTGEIIDTPNNLISYTENERFAGGIFCPHCGCTHIVRNGHRQSDNVQRYLCRDCGKSFVANSVSVTSCTRKDLKIRKMPSVIVVLYIVFLIIGFAYTVGCLYRLFKKISSYSDKAGTKEKSEPSTQASDLDN